MRRQGLLSLTGVLLLVLLALLTLHEWEQVVPTGASSPGDRDAPPVLQLTGVAGSSFNDQGTLDFRLDASGMEWLEEEGLSRFTEPRLWLPLKQGEWQIAADSGSMEEDSGRIALSGNVVARRDGVAPLQLETGKLFYLTRAEQVRVPGPVTVISGQGRIQAGALEADLRAETLQLHRGVETRYAPSP